MCAPTALVSIYHSSNIHEAVHTDGKGLLRPCKLAAPWKIAQDIFMANIKSIFPKTACVYVDP